MFAAALEVDFVGAASQIAETPGHTIGAVRSLPYVRDWAGMAASPVMRLCRYTYRTLPTLLIIFAHSETRMGTSHPLAEGAGVGANRGATSIRANRQRVTRAIRLWQRSKKMPESLETARFSLGSHR